MCVVTTLSLVAQKAAIDKAFDAALQGVHRDEAMEMLENIAEGRPIDVVKAVAAKAGLTSYIDDGLGIDSLRTRRYAVERIGETDLPEAVQYLQMLTEGHVGRDDSRTIYPNAKLALQKALFRREKEPGQQIAFS
jgi:hypothetical protein